MSGGEDLGARLCTQCGLCCSGVVLSGVLIGDEEAAFAERHRLVLIDTPAGKAFAHPCPVLDRTRCGDYEHRPRACRRFACKVLRGVEQGERAIDDAIAAVTALSRDAASIAERVEPTSRPRLWQLAALVADASTPADARSAAEAALSALLPELTALRARVNDLIVSPEENAASRSTGSGIPQG